MCKYYDTPTHSQLHIALQTTPLCPTPTTTITPSESQTQEGSDPTLACTGSHFVPRGHTRTHAQVTCKQPFLTYATNSSCPSQKWPEQLPVCLSVCLSILRRRHRYIRALCSQVPAALWNSQKLAFVPFPTFGDRNLQDCCPGPARLALHLWRESLPAMLWLATGMSWTEARGKVF